MTVPGAVQDAARRGGLGPQVTVLPGCQDLWTGRTAPHWLFGDHVIVDIVGNPAYIKGEHPSTSGQESAITNSGTICVGPAGDGSGARPVGERHPAGEQAPTRDVARPQGEPVLEARQLIAGYGELAAVRGLDLALHAGEIVALLGPNGAGKTTALSTLAGALPPLAGEVRFLGDRVTSPLHARVRAGLGYIPEERSVMTTIRTCATGVTSERPALSGLNQQGV